MQRGNKALLAIISLVVGFYIGRAYFPAAAANRYVIPLGGEVKPATPAPQPAAAAPATGVYAPYGASSYPTPYPTPASTTSVLPPSSNLSAYPTPYPPPAAAVQAGSTTSLVVASPTPAVTSSSTSRLPSFENVDWSAHLLYVVLGLLAVAAIAKKNDNEVVLCLAMIMLGAIAGRYLDFGPVYIPRIVGIAISRRNL